MSVIESPTNDGVNLEIDPTFSAARVTLRPHDFKGAGGSNIGGHYRTVATTGATTVLAAAAPIFSMRWANPDRAHILNRVNAYCTIGTAFGAAQEVSLDLVRVTNMINPDTGGTAIVLGEAGRKSRSNMQASVVADMRIAAAVALGAGAGSVEEGAPMCVRVSGGLLNVVGSMAGGPLFDFMVGHEGPIVSMRNEGFRIRNRTLMGAAGVVVWTFEFEWSEVPTSLLGS
jgi:hypothetical protein